jgi:hypothetical protein
MCSPAVDPAWQLKINPDRIRLRALLSIQLPLQACSRKWHYLGQRTGQLCLWGDCPRGHKVGGMLILGPVVEFSGSINPRGKQK